MNKYLVDDCLENAMGDSREWIENVYKKIYIKELNLCGKKIISRARINNLSKTIFKLKKFGMTNDDFSFYEKNTYENFKYRTCILPKGHSGSCNLNFSGHNKIYKKFVENKLGFFLKSVQTTPGNKYFYKNRADRTYPFLISKNVNSALIDKFGKKEYNLFIPVRDGGTPEMRTSALLDIYSFLFSLFGDDFLVKNHDKHSLELIKDNLNRLKQVQTRSFKNDKLCCPVFGWKIKKEDFFNRDREDDTKIEFGHIESVKKEKFMTRGNNIFPVTRTGNRMIGDNNIYSKKGNIYINKIAKDFLEHQEINKDNIWD